MWYLVCSGCGRPVLITSTATRKEDNKNLAPSLHPPGGYCIQHRSLSLYLSPSATRRGHTEHLCITAQLSGAICFPIRRTLETIHEARTD